MRILFFGDVVGKSGCDVLAARLQPLRRALGADLVVVNGENAASGMGITRAVAQEIFRLGADVITLGNHTWDKKEILTYIDEEPHLLRPLNYPPGTPGVGRAIITAGGVKVAILSLHGRVFFPFFVDDPFRSIDAELDQLADVPVRLVDFHAEATSEKQVMGYYLDGRVSAVLGTHTHVQTADARVLPGGTAYMSDVGMCGPFHSIIGMEPDLALERFRTQLPVRLAVATGPAILSAALVEIDPKTGTATRIEAIQETPTTAH